MTPLFTLWDLEAGTSLGTYETEEEAVAVVRELVRVNGGDYADVLEVGYQDEAGKWRVIGNGTEATRPLPTSTASQA